MILTSLRPLANLKLSKMMVRYSPSKVPLLREAEVLTNNFNPRRAKTLYLFENTPSDILRWIITTDPSAKALPLSTQRNRLRRRWNAAVVDALRNQGLDSKGRKVSIERIKHEEKHREPIPFLKGTMEVAIYEGYGFTETAQTLAEHAGRIVRALLSTKNSTIASDGPALIRKP